MIIFTKRWHLYDFYIGAALSNFLHYFCRLAKTQREMCVWKTRTTGSDTKWPLFALLPLIPNLTPFRFTLRLGDTSHIFIVPEYPSAKLFILGPEKEQLPTIQKLSLATIVTVVSTCTDKSTVLWLGVKISFQKPENCDLIFVHQARYCSGLSPEEENELQLFAAQRKQNAFGRGSARVYLPTSFTPTRCSMVSEDF